MPQVGYARVSTGEQNLDLQFDALTKAGCERIFQDKESGAKDDRIGLASALSYLGPGDCLTVWRLDRLGRSVQHLVSTVTELRIRGVEFRSLTESIDTTTPGGKLVFVIFAGLAEFERDLITVRVRAGLEAARARGRFGGRPIKLSDEKIKLAFTLLNDKQIPASQVCEMLGVGRSTLYRHLRENKK